MKETGQELINKIFEAKKEFHKQQAQLPIEEKIRQLVELQKISANIYKSRGIKSSAKVWQIKEN